MVINSFLAKWATWNWMVRVTSDFYFDFLYKLIFDLQSFDNGEKDDFDGSEHDVIVESSLPVFFFYESFRLQNI